MFNISLHSEESVEERLEGGKSCPQEREVDKTFFLSPLLSVYHHLQHLQQISDFGHKKLGIQVVGFWGINSVAGQLSS